MKYTKEGEFTHLTEINTDELSFLIRLDIPMLVYAHDKNNKINSVIAFSDNLNKKIKSRNDSKNFKYTVDIKSTGKLNGKKSLTPMDVLKTAADLSKGVYDIGVTIRNKWLDKYNIIFPLIGKIKNSALENYYLIKVSDEYIMLKGKDVGQYPQEVYYFHDDYSLLKFDEKGFTTLVDKSKSKFNTAIILNSVKFK